MSAKDPHNQPDSLEVFFKKRLHDGKLPPPELTWGNLEEELNRMEKEKRRRRFLWFFFSGLVLIGGLTCAWIFFNPFTKTKNKSIVTPGKQTTENENKIAEKPVVKNNSEQTTENTDASATAKIAENVPANVSSNEKTVTRIQLGAYRGEANKKAFEKVPLPVVEEKGDDGYTRYFAESTGDQHADLRAVQEAGFPNAFIRKTNTTLATKEQRHEINLLAENKSSKKKQSKENTSSSNVSFSTSGRATAVSLSKQADENSAREKPGAQKNISPDKETKTSGLKTKEANVAEAKTQNQNSAAVGDAGNAIVANNGKPGGNKNSSAHDHSTPVTNSVTPGPATTQSATPVTAETKKDSSQPAAEVAKTDTAKKEGAKKDSIPPKVASVDSSKNLPFIPEFSIMLGGGPTIMISKAQSNYFPNSTSETQPNRYNGEVSFQWRPLKLFSVSLGASYNTFTVKRDDTVVKFDKHQADDFLFYTSYGTIPVPMSTMLEGFNPNFPLDTFMVHYTYNASLQTINVPLQANLHFINTKRVNVFLGGGINTVYALSQQNHLTVIKENFNNEVDNNRVTVNRFNAMLTLGLGCDVRIYKKLYFTLAPSYRYALNNQSATSGITFKPQYFSANGGLKIKF